MESLVSNLVNFFLLSSVMVIVALVIRTVMQKKLNISIMMMIWMVVLIRMIVPFTLNAPMHVSDFIESEPEIIESSDVLSVNQETSTTILAESNTNNIAINQTQTASIQPITQNETVELDAESMPNTFMQFVKGFNYKKIALWVWAIGVFVAFVMHMTKLLIFKNRIKPYMRRINQSNILFKIQKRIGLFRMVSLYECACIDMPMTMGLFAPKIIIPRGLASKISSEKLDMILTHELCHIKRYDLLKAYLWLVAKSIHWFNPFVYMAYNAYLEDMESLCDKTVVSYFNDEKAEAIYSQALVDVIKLAKFSDEPYALISFCKDKTKLRKRVIQMIDPNKKSKLIGVLSVLLIMIAMVGCFTTACMGNESEETEKLITQEQKDIDWEQQAIELAKKYSITDASDFVYDSESMVEGLKVHTVYADGIDTSYMIYEDSGMPTYISTFTVEKTEEYEISIDEAQEIVVDTIEKFWKGTEYELFIPESSESKIDNLVYCHYIISGIIEQKGEDFDFYFTLNGKGEIEDLSVMSRENKKVGSNENKTIDNQVGTEERAIEIAMHYNISDAESMRYEGYDIYKKEKIHRVAANDDTDTFYEIYDFDGSLYSMMNMKRDIVYEDYKIDVEQAQRNAVDIIKSYYPKYDDINVEITMTGTEDDHVPQFVGKGAMENKETSTKRDIFIVLDAAGEFDSMRCTVTPESLANISDGLESKVIQYSLTNDTYIEYLESVGFYGDEILIFMIDDGYTMVKMLKSDQSLVSIATKLFDVKVPMKIDEEEALNIINEKSLEYFPNSKLDISQYGWVEGLEPIVLFEANGDIILANGERLEFKSELNGEGELIDIGVTPQKSDNADSIISIEEAEQKAKEAVYEHHPKTKDKLKVVKAYEGEVNNKDAFIFDIQYRTENPTAFDYAFDVTIEVFKSNGEALCRIVSPIYDGLSMISEQEAIEKAKEYILDEYSLDEDKMKFKSIEILPFSPIEYKVIFEYDEYTYSAGLIIDTGERDGVGMGKE